MILVTHGLEARSNSREPTKPVTDSLKRDVLLFDSEWALKYCVEGNPGVRFHELVV